MNYEIVNDPDRSFSLFTVKDGIRNHFVNRFETREEAEEYGETRTTHIQCQSCTNGLLLRVPDQEWTKSAFPGEYFRCVRCTDLHCF